MNSPTRGYFYSGTQVAGSITHRTEVDGIRFDTEAAINPAATAAVARGRCAGLNSLTRGYACGGNGAAVTAEIDGLRFDTEATINPAAALSLARQAVNGANSSLKGYCAGGYTAGGVHSLAIDGIRFDTEAAFLTSATLVSGRTSPSGFNSATHGYFYGGGSNPSEIDGINFATETAINPAATVANSAQYFGAGNSTTPVNSTAKGYAAGGGGLSGSTLVQGFVFSSETSFNLGNILPANRMAAFGVQSGGAL